MAHRSPHQSVSESAQDQEEEPGERWQHMKKMGEQLDLSVTGVKRPVSNRGS